MKTLKAIFEGITTLSADSNDLEQNINDITNTLDLLRKDKPEFRKQHYTKLVSAVKILGQSI